MKTVKQLSISLLLLVCLCVCVNASADEGTLVATTTAEESASNPTAQSPAPKITAEPVQTPVPAVVVQAPAPPPPVQEEPAKPNPNKFKMGMLFDIASPSLFALGAEARLPYVPWVKPSVALTIIDNVGLRGGVLIDPIKFGIAPVGAIEVGHQFPLTAPGIKNSPEVSFNYANFLAGIGLGNRDGFRFLLMGGMTYLDGSAGNVSKTFSLPTGFTVANPRFSGWIPAAKIGFSLLF